MANTERAQIIAEAALHAAREHGLPDTATNFYPLATIVYDRAVAHLTDPNTWDAVAQVMGEHDYTYDLSDRSHRLDVVQIVCEALARSWRT